MDSKIGPQHTAFVVKFRHPDAADDPRRSKTAVQTYAAVAFFLGGKKMPGQGMAIVHNREVLVREIGFLCLELLNANHIGVLRTQPLQTAFCGGGSNASEVK